MGPDLVRLALSAGEHPAGPCRSPTNSNAALNSAQHPPPGGWRCAAAVVLTDDPDVLLQAVAAHRTGPRPTSTRRHARTPGSLSGTPRARPGGRFAQRGGRRLRAARGRSGRRPSPIGATHTGDPTVPPSAQRRPSFGWNSLTATEMKVVSLVAEGHTNRQIAERLFVSRRTIATHIEHVFQKLGHANRVELAADVAHSEASAISRRQQLRQHPKQPPANRRTQAPAPPPR